MSDPAGCDREVCGTPAWQILFRRLRDSGRIAHHRAAAKQSQGEKVAGGQFGDRLKADRVLRGRYGRNLCQQAAALVEGELGEGPLFRGVVSDQDVRADLAAFIHDRIERSTRNGIDGAYRDARAEQRKHLTAEAKAALAGKEPPRPDHVARYIDGLKAFTSAPVFDADGQPALAADLSPDDYELLVTLTERVLGRVRELVRAYPPPDAAAARMRAFAKLIDADLASSPGSGGSAQFPRAGEASGATEKLRTGAANRSVLSFVEDVEAPLRELVGDSGQTRGQANHFSTTDHAASVFSPNLALWQVTNYSLPGGIVIDPFAGGGTRAVASALAGRRYVGVDVREDEVERVNARLRDLGLDRLAIVHHGDSATFDWTAALDGDRANAVVTCPPYFNLERYSEDPADLSTAPSYDGFLDGLRRVIAALVPVLAPGAVAAWVVGEVRDGETKRLFRIHQDLRDAHEDAGFDPFERDIAYRRNQRPRSEGREAAHGRVVPVHEHVVVTRFPGDTSEPAT